MHGQAQWSRRYFSFSGCFEEKIAFSSWFDEETAFFGRFEEKLIALKKKLHFQADIHILGLVAGLDWRNLYFYVDLMRKLNFHVLKSHLGYFEEETKGGGHFEIRWGKAE